MDTKNIIIERFNADRESNIARVSEFHSFLCRYDAKSFLKLVMTALVSEESQSRLLAIIAEGTSFTYGTPEEIAVDDLIEEVCNRVVRETHSERNAGAHEEATRQSRRDNYNGKFATYTTHFAKEFQQVSI